ncbi:two-component regulator propeller domain-containing protein [Mucilaginibacter sp. BT774]|uniref:ligand-binding sensor domain-containing protein n=1 Tax=Mucilaginibacter sp. BT774 TaxID=3062276 RepID=UPI0026753FA1|nr:sensor histidine kinase [Mucilaginibacter sp. BT774]MDO3628614.1 two-component regulator propeller domain-containing protein [Mucilaginibacter sp. BT774]
MNTPTGNVSYVFPTAEIKRYFFNLTLTLCFICCASDLHAQKYDFRHYDLTNGLAQSQVLAICQDKEKQIWLSTLGGINSFDGKKFSTYSIEDGLMSNSNFVITCDRTGNILWGGNSGLTAFTNKGIVNYKFRDKINVRTIYKLITDKNNGIWSVAASKLFKLVDNQLVVQDIIAKKDYVSSLQTDKQGNLYASLYHSGIYKLDKSGWKLMIRVKDQYIKDFVFSEGIPGAVVFVSDMGLFKCDSAHIERINFPSSFSETNEFTCIRQDHHKNLWIGTNKGAFMISGQSVKYFNEDNGFTNERVFSMYCDEDGRMWFGIDGDGLYSYENDDFIIYDKTQGLNNEAVMSLAKDSKGQLYWGTNGGGLWSFTNHKLKQELVKGKESSKLRVNCLLNDNKDNLWVGTDNLGLWVKKYGNRDYSPVSVSNGLIFNHLAEGRSNTIWMATSYGCYYLEDGQMVHVPSLNQYSSAVLPQGPDSVFVATLNGVLLVKNKQWDTKFALDAVAGKNIITLYSHGPFILLGTNDYGLYIWNTKTNAISNINTKSGLLSNTIYSIDIIKNALWLGTGKGINKFRITDHRRMTLTKESIFNPIVECNQNAIMHTDTNIWLGTTRGLFVFKTNKNEKDVPVPNTVIQSVWLPAKIKDSIKYAYQQGYKLPANLSLSSDKSHIEIEYQAIDFSDDRNVLYQHQLEGLDKTYGKAEPRDYVEYPNLPPGQYTFKVRAVNSDGLYKTAATFSFTITPTFVQSATFKILVIVIFLSAAYGIYRYKIYQNNRKTLYIEQLKLEEQAFVRRQTAEDFHDDLGNKLTRINLLSELLDKKITKDKADEKLLIQHIRNSVDELYSGTKNILWALNPDNDNLYDVYELVMNFGRELFSGSDLVYQVSDNDLAYKRIRLPLGMGRNIILICKELLHNILQHAGAKTVTLAIGITSYKQICITISDNGRGFDKEHLVPTGNGLRNMQNRAKRLNGKLEIESNINVGTTGQLTFPIPG